MSPRRERRELCAVVAKMHSCIAKAPVEARGQRSNRNLSQGDLTRRRCLCNTSFLYECVASTFPHGAVNRYSEAMPVSDTNPTNTAFWPNPAHRPQTTTGRWREPMLKHPISHISHKRREFRDGAGVDPEQEACANTSCAPRCSEAQRVRKRRNAIDGGMERYAR